jgi:uncharacterized membrane protein YcaP (DUF421 family)
MTWITDVIGAKGDVLWWQMSVRAVLILVFGLVLIRLLGRRAFGQQNPLDIVVAIVVGSSLSRALTGNSPFFSTLAAMAVLLLVFWLLDHAAARSRLLGKLTKGDPVSLARDHRFDRKALALWGITEGDIAEAARASGMPGVEAVKDAVLERSGKISTIGGS